MQELRNPYNGMSYTELSEEILGMEQALAAAALNKKFSLCEEIQSKIHAAERAREKKPIPEEVPESRVHLERLIEAARFAIAHAHIQGNTSTVSRLEGTPGAPC